jgi:hypothetical protein
MGKRTIGIQQTYRVARRGFAQVTAVAVALLCVQCESSAIAQGVLLEWRIPENSKRVSTQTSSMSQVMDANGLKVKTSVKQTLVATTTAGKRAADGTLPVMNEVRSLKAKMTLPFDVELDYDSAKEFKKPGTSIDGLLESLHGFSTAKWTSVLDRKLRAVSIDGNEEFLATLTEEAQDGLKKQLSEEELLRRHNQLIDAIPAEPVGVGDTWTRVHYADFDLGQMLKFEKKFRYDGVLRIDGRPLDKISQTTTAITVELGDNPVGLKLKESLLEIDSTKGEIFFDRRSGWIHESHEEVKISGSMSFELRGRITNSKIQLMISNHLSVE